MMEERRGSFRGAGSMRLAARCWRPRERPARAVFAIVHGIGEHSGRYAAYVDHLAPRGFAVYGFDLRGHGRSPGPRGHIRRWSDLREDVGAFLRTVRGQEPDTPIFLFGHSLGGLIVLEYVLHHPEGLTGVIASAPPLGKIGVSPVLLALSKALSRLWPRFSLPTRLEIPALSRDPAIAEAYRADPLVHDRGSARMATEFQAAVTWTNANAGTLRLPLLIVHGEADRIVAAEGSRAFAEAVSSPDRLRTEYHGGYHELHHDLESASVLSDIAAWMEQRIPQR